jgi:hypothetical protein
VVIISLNNKEDKRKMNNKKLLLSLAILGVLMCVNLASAYVNYGSQVPSCPSCGGIASFAVRSYGYDPSIRVGGFFGQNSMSIIGLRPGTAYQNCYQGAPAMFYKPCNGLRTGGFYGYNSYSNYYGLRNYGYGGYGGYGTKYSNINYLYNGVM